VSVLIFLEGGNAISELVGKEIVMPVLLGKYKENAFNELGNFKKAIRHVFHVCTVNVFFRSVNKQ
jgi:hypothetical protein